MAQVATDFWQPVRSHPGKIQCDLCPRYCHLSEGQRGLCFVRGNVEGEIQLLSYGRSSGFCIDPIEKKPLNHFLPGTPVLSFGTAGCNLACKFCQNWDISKSKQMDTLASAASPDQLSLAAKQSGCRSIAYTYNDPIVFYEYALDVAQASREQGIKNVAVTAGYICEEPRAHFFAAMDAVNIDLKSFSERFYRKICGGHLQPVLDTIEYVAKETDVWLELTTLLIPDENDSDEELHQLCQWLREHLGTDVPLHFSGFHPDWKMKDKPRTPLGTLVRARDIALQYGLKFVYTGNVHDQAGDTTFCSGCHQPLIVRDWYHLVAWRLTPEGTCPNCDTPLPGKFEAEPGGWGAKRQVIRPAEFGH